MRRPAAVIGLFLVCCMAACTLRRQVTPASPYCRGGNPLAGVYHPLAPDVSRAAAASQSEPSSKVVFEPYDGDVHIDLRPTTRLRAAPRDGNDRVGGNLVVEVIPYDRSARCGARAKARASRLSGPGSQTTSTAGTRSTRRGGSARAASSPPRRPSCARRSYCCSNASDSRHESRPRGARREPRHRFAKAPKQPRGGSPQQRPSDMRLYERSAG